MSLIIDFIVDAIVRSITYAIVVSVSTSIRNSIRNSVSKSLSEKLEKFLDANGEVDEEKINSLIKVNTYALGSGLYDVTIKEDVFGILDLQLISTKDTTQLFRLIQKELVIFKIKAKMRKNNEQVALINAMLEGFNNDYPLCTNRFFITFFCYWLF